MVLAPEDLCPVEGSTNQKVRDAGKPNENSRGTLRKTSIGSWQVQEGELGQLTD